MKLEVKPGMTISARLRELREEYEQGQAKLMELEQYRQELRDGLMRIAGAIQILEEFSQEDPHVAPQAATDEEK